MEIFFKSRRRFQVLLKLLPICFIYFAEESSWCQKGSSQDSVYQFMFNTCWTREGKKAGPVRRPGHPQQGITSNAHGPCQPLLSPVPRHRAFCGLLLEIPGCPKQSTEHAFLLVVPVIASFGLSLCEGKSLSYYRNCVRNPIKSKEVIFKGKVATLCIQFTGFHRRLPELLRP